MRIFGQSALRVGKGDLAEQTAGRCARVIGRARAVGSDRLDDLVSHRPHRIERGAGLLKDERNRAATNAAPLGLRAAAERDTLQANVPRDARAFGREIEQRAREEGLAAAALPDDGQ